jgi:hypothetical protein
MNSRASGDHNIVANINMADYAGLAADNHTLSQLSTSGNTNLRRYNLIFANDNIVSNLYKIINFHITLNPCFSKSSPI